MSFPLSKVPEEVLLHIAEHMDTKTLSNFALTNAAHASLVKSYKNSICKGRVAVLIRSIPFASKGNVLRSKYSEREVISVNTRQHVLELERRISRVAKLMNIFHPILAAYQSHPEWLGQITGEIKDKTVHKLGNLIKRGLWLCDAIGDIAANDPCIYPSAGWDSIDSLPAINDVTSLEYIATDPHANVSARPHQARFIRSLPLDDCLALWYTILALSNEYVSRKKQLFWQDCLLRHGTWFLEAQLDENHLNNHVSYCLRHRGEREMRDFQNGISGIPLGLQAVLFLRINQLLGLEISESIFTQAKLRHAYEAILGTIPQPYNRRKKPCFIQAFQVFFPARSVPSMVMSIEKGDATPRLLNRTPASSAGKERRWPRRTELRLMIRDG